MEYDSAGVKRTRRTREETISEILDAAEDLFSRRAPGTVTVREIAAQAGVTHPLVHQYLGSKTDILRAVLEREAFSRRKFITAATDVQDAIPGLTDGILKNRVQSRSSMRAAMDNIEYVPLEVRVESGRMLLELAQETVGRGRTRAPSPPAVDPRVVLAAYIAMAFGWASAEDWLVRLFDLEDADRDELHDKVQDLSAYLVELMFPPEAEGTE